MPNQLPAGPALDERVCRALGWGQVLDMMRPGSFLGWPAVSTSGDVMLDAIEVMRGRGWDAEVAVGPRVSGALCGLNLWVDGNGSRRHRKRSFHALGNAPAHAVALAILAALEPEGV